MAALQTQLAAFASAQAQAQTHLAAFAAAHTQALTALVAAQSQQAQALAKMEALAAQMALSPLERLLEQSAPSGPRGTIFRFLTQSDARPLRVVSRACREAVAEHEWGVGSASQIRGSLALWRRCFPRASQNTSDADMVHLSGIHTLDMSRCW